jgi:predicted nucleotidyltransferase
VTHAVVRRRRERAERIAQATAWAVQLERRLRVHAVAVVGSVARGDFNKWSDLDVLVIADGLPGDPLERLALLDTGALAVEADTIGVVVRGRLD